ncbi:18961_t:CDS:2, partial [Dentiscutata erythropus]
MSSTNTTTDTSSGTSQASSPIVIIIIVVAIVALAIGVLVILYFRFQRNKKRKDKKLKPFMLSPSRIEPTPHPHKNTTRGVDISHIQKHDAPSVMFDVTESERRGSREKEVISEEESIGSPTLVREGPGGLRRTPTRSMTMPMPSRGEYSEVSQHQHFT